MNIDRYRTLFVIVTASAVPLVALLWWFTSRNAYEAYGYPVFALYLVWVLWALTARRMSARGTIAVSHVVMTVFWLGLMGFRLFGAPEAAPVSQRLTPDVYMVFLVLSVMAHLLFATRRALRASAGILIGTALISLSWIVIRVSTGAPLEGVGHLVTYEGILAVAMIMVNALARSKDDHALALLETERMRELAYRDTLTSLPNRRQLHESLQRIAALAEQYGRPLSVISFDIDHFKTINDTLGHQVGDSVLEDVRRSIQPLIRTGDTVGRWGGEEFLIIVPNTDHDRAIALAERIRRAIEGHIYPHGVSITASFGVATHAASTSIGDLLSRADASLYEAKRAGRNRVAGEVAITGGGPSREVAR